MTKYYPISAVINLFTPLTTGQNYTSHPAGSLLFEGQTNFRWPNDLQPILLKLSIKWYTFQTIIMFILLIDFVMFYIDKFIDNLRHKIRQG